MILSRSQMKMRLNPLIDGEVLERIQDKTNRQSQDLGKDKKMKPVSKPFLTGKRLVTNRRAYKECIENFYGLAQVPVGLIGPLKVNGAYAGDSYTVPLATTEGALVASYNRGAKLISMSGGANVLCLSETMTRSPGFIFGNALESARFVAWVSENFHLFQTVVRRTTKHGHLEDFDSMIDGKYVWINFKYVSGDAAGQNMVTIATDAICQYIEVLSPIKPKKWYIDANLSGDKKATRYSALSGRGKHMVADITISKKFVQRILHTTPEDIVDYSRMAMVAGVQTGSIGVNGHFVNALAALFIACGQDAACVAESATGTSKAELTESGDLYVSITLPNLVVGTVGGGTHLPTQKEALELMGCYGSGQSRKFAEICTATVMAGEISIAAAMAAGHFTQAHKKYGRKNQSDKGIDNGHKTFIQ